MTRTPITTATEPSLPRGWQKAVAAMLDVHGNPWGLRLRHVPRQKRRLVGEDEKDGEDCGHGQTEEGLSGATFDQ